MNDKKRFTLRLNEEEYKELSRIKGLTGTKTNTKAIRFLISHFVELNKRYTEEINKNTLLKEEYKKQDRCVESFLASIQGLEALKDLHVVTAGRIKSKDD